MLETGAVVTVREIAAAENINESYVSRVLRLTLLAPDIVEPILDGRQPTKMTPPVLMGAFPVEWAKQGPRLSGRPRTTARHVGTPERQSGAGKAYWHQRRWFHAANALKSP